VLKRTGAWDRVCVTSFSGRRLLAAQKILDHPVCLAVTPAAIAAVRYAGFPGRAMAARLARSGAQCAQVPRRIATREFIRRAHELGLHVHVWTLNRREEIERILDLGADGVMTDDVVLLRDILTERGQWYPRVAVLAVLARGDDPPETPRARGTARPPVAPLAPRTGGLPVPRSPPAPRTGAAHAAETRSKRDWMPPAPGILSGYPVLPIRIANRLGGNR